MLILCTWVENVAAQYNSEYNTFVGGLVAGANFSQVDGDGYKGYNKAGINAGGIIYLPFGDMDMPIEGTIALSMEVLYAQKGSISKGPNPGYNVRSQQIRMDYGEVPIQINYYRGVQKSSAGMGFSIGYLARYEELIEKLSGGTIIRNDYPFRRYELSFVMTANIHIWKGFYISPRFQYSLIPIRIDSGGYGRNQQFNNILSARIMYLFGKRKSAWY